MTILWRSKHSQDRCKLRTKTILNANRHVWTRHQKRDGLIEHVKVKTLAFKNCNVASRLRISGLWGKFTIWRKLLFLGVLFRKFSYQRWKYSRQTGQRDTLVFASRQQRQRANYLFISTVSYLDLNQNEEKTCYLQWILVKLTVLQVGLFVMWGTHDLSPEHERWHCKV